MVRCEAWLLKGLLGLTWLLPILMSHLTPVPCSSLETLKDQLNSTLRRRYLKHNFPINYTMQVPYEEVFRLKNISKLKNDSASERDLQVLWATVTEKSIDRILQVLPERHPTRRKYLTNLKDLFKVILESNPELRILDESKSESIENILTHLKDEDYQGWKSVKPKSLLDNCYRTMHCIFNECFSGNSTDYCQTQHWRKGKEEQG
ncbi:interleukin-34 [Clarias gariepinus]|uniref:interleukin-34 n=1 Tax=Clarias gariepinus TaxID=13013 RepID=UPI00234CA26B|nr:interleukin-34 [Clarias gariepinus]